MRSKLLSEKDACNIFSYNIKEIFCERLSYVMDLREISTSALAERIFVSRSTVSGYRTGYRRPDIEQLFLISIALSVSTDYLLGLTDEIHG